MNCGNCGKAVPPGSQFCPHCGTAAGAPAAPPIAVPAKLAKAAGTFVGRVWALERIDAWLRDGEERLFLLLGEPGAGKSQLSAWLCGAGPAPEQLEAAAALERVRRAWSAACFCMSRGQGGSIDAAWYIRSLVEQLSNRYEGYAGAVLEAVDGLISTVTIKQDIGENRGTAIALKADTLKIGPVPDALDRHALTVVEPLTRFATKNPAERIVILVDGVDEALGQSPTIVTLVARAGSLPDNVRFLVTSRPTDRITNPLRDAFDGSVAVLDISADAAKPLNDADIRAYVDMRASAQAGPAMTPEFAAGLVEQAAGNFLFIDFLMDDLVAGTGSVESLPATPLSLYQLYRSFLDRVVPGVAQGVNEEWLTRYLPLLGTISVAVPAAPQAPLWQWLGWNETELAPVIEPVQQLTEWTQDDGGGWRLYHRSMGDFLATPRLADSVSPTPRPNAYYVSPPEQHDRIVAHYLKACDERWGGNWAACDDTYCLRNLVRHMAAGAEPLPAAARARRTNQLFALLEDPSYRARQFELLGGPDATVDDFRTALELAKGMGDVTRVGQLVETLAAAPEADLRGLAVRWFVEMYRTEPQACVNAMKGLLSSPSPNAWRVALNAAFQVS